MSNPQRIHPLCRDLGCRSEDHLICPVECELLQFPEVGESADHIIPLAFLTPPTNTLEIAT